MFLVGLNSYKLKSSFTTTYLYEHILSGKEFIHARVWSEAKPTELNFIRFFLLSFLPFLLIYLFFIYQFQIIDWNSITSFIVNIFSFHLLLVIVLGLKLIRTNYEYNIKWRQDSSTSIEDMKCFNINEIF